MSDCQHREEITKLRERVVVLEQLPPRVAAVEQLVEKISKDVHASNVAVAQLTTVNHQILKNQEAAKPTLNKVNSSFMLLRAVVIGFPLLFMALDYFELTPFQAVDQIKQVEQTKGVSHESANRST